MHEEFFDNVHERLNNIFRDTIFDDDHIHKSSMNDDASKFYGYMEDTNQDIYMDCKFTKLCVIVCLSYGMQTGKKKKTSSQ